VVARATRKKLVRGLKLSVWIFEGVGQRSGVSKFEGLKRLPYITLEKFMRASTAIVRSLNNPDGVATFLA
jgi:hypothetical protein